MSRMEGNSIEHLNYFIKKIIDKEHFGVIRTNDGEYMILNNIHFKTQDIWKFNGGLVAKDLSEAVQKFDKIDNFYIGIPCKDCNNKMYEYYNKMLNKNQNRITYGNLFQNTNWKIFINFLKTNNVPFYYIGPGKSETNELNVLDRFYIDEFLIEDWDNQREVIIKDIKEWVKDKPINSLFFFSAGPLTKIFVPLLIELEPNNSYIDCGSALDLFMKGKTNRPYILDKNSIYANMICDFIKGHN